MFFDTDEQSLKWTYFRQKFFSKCKNNKCRKYQIVPSVSRRRERWSMYWNDCFLFLCFISSSEEGHRGIAHLENRNPFYTGFHIRCFCECWNISNMEFLKRGPAHYCIISVFIYLLLYKNINKRKRIFCLV